MNLGELKTEVFRRLNESASSPVFWSVADVERAINDGQEELADATEFYERHTRIDLLSHRTYYDLRHICEDTFIAPRRVYNNEISKWLDPSHVRDFDAIRQRWETNTGQPMKWFMRGTWWLGLYPQPDADFGSIRFYYAAIPPELVEDEDAPQFPDEYHEALIEYAIYDLEAQDAETDQALVHYANYLGFEQRLKRYVDSRLSPDRVERH